MKEQSVLKNYPAVKSLAARISETPVPYFLSFWLLLNLAQITFTELTSDEGYYWFYAQHLQWGYYDHPPMVALLIKLGTLLFHGESGVRFFNVLFSTGGLYLFFTLLPEGVKKSRVTYVVLLSAPLLHYLCFIVFPDGPLLFFSLLFLVLYKRFLKEANAGLAILLGVSIALMAWSKYHGALVVLFTVLANPKLLKSGYFYLSLLVALLLFAPHLWWQYQNHFPTLKYHLAGRTGSYSFKHVGEYLSQQLIAIGPGLIFIPFVVKAKHLFERTLKFIIIGTFAFFLASSFKTFVHFHWTSVALFPILYFAVLYYQSAQRKKLFNYLILPFVFLFFIIRLLLAVPLIPAMHAGEDYYHGRRTWAKEIVAIAGNRPVFMPNNLREASLYSFYSGNMGVTLYTRPEKRSQYELWGFEDSLRGKEVLFVSKYPFNGSQPLANSLHQHLQWASLPGFNSYYTGLKMYASIYQRTADSLFTTIDIKNNRNDSATFNGDNQPVSLIYIIEKNNEVLRADPLFTFLPADKIASGESLGKHFSSSIKDLRSGQYTIYFGIRSGVLPDAILSNANHIEVR